MKKTKMLVLSIILSLTYVRTAYASLPDKTLIIGSKAYSISDSSSIANNISNIRQDIYNNPSSIYYKDNGSIVDIFTGLSIGGESSIASRSGSKISYYDSNGGSSPQVYAYSNGEFNTTTNNTDAFVDISVESNKVTDGFFVATVKLSKPVGISGQGYYKVGNSSNTKVSDAVTIPYMTNGGQLDLFIYPNDQSSVSPIASGKIIMPTVGDTNTAKADYTISLTVNSTINISQYYTGQGNMSNGGYVSGDSKYIYYSNTADLGKIYKTSLDGLENYIICDDNAKYIALYGDWIYYSNYSDNSKLYKVKTDGTGKRKVSDDVASYINVKDDKIYYCNGLDKNKNKIYVIDATGVSQPLTSEEASYPTLTNGYLYYSNMDDSGKLYKMGLDGSNKQKYAGMDSPIKFINSAPNLSQVYFVTSDGSLYHGLDNIPVRYSKIDKNGISSAPVDDKVSNINVVGNTVYYKSLLDGGKLYKVDASSGGIGEKIAEDSVEFINVYAPDPSDNSKDVIYYIKSGKLYKVLDPIIKVGTNGVQTKTLVSSAVTKLKQTDKITKVDNITEYCNNDDVGKTISQIDIYKYLPDKVSAIFSDNTVRQVVVSWNTAKITSKNGIYTLSGTVVGYGNNITVSLIMASDFGISPNDINIINVVGLNNDSVTVNAGTGLIAGDILKVYNPDTSKIIGTGTAASDGSIDIQKLNLKSDGGILLFTVTKTGQAESRQVSKAYGREMPKAPTGIGIDLQRVEDDTATNDVGGFTISANDLFGNSIGDNDIDNLEFIIGTYDSKKTSVINWSGTWISCNSTDNIQIPKNGMQIKVRTKAVSTSGTPASVATNAIVIQTRPLAPLGVGFDEKNGIINNVGTTMEYNNNGTVLGWIACNSASIQGVTYPLDKPVKVRYASTKNSLPSLETVQIKINSIVSATDPTISPNYAVTTDGGKVYLKSPVPVVWSVTEANGTTTTKATVTQSNVVKDANGDTVYTTTVQGFENGVARINATDAAGQKGYLDILMSNQTQITVASDIEFNNALPRNDIKTIVLKPYIYNINSFDLGTLGKELLTIKGQGNNCQINVASVAAGNFINTNGKQLKLQDLVIDGNGIDIENAINANSATDLKGVTFRNIKNSDVSKSSAAVNFTADSGDLNIDKSTFEGTNTMNGAIVVGTPVKGNISITNNTFTAMQKALKQQTAYIQNSSEAVTTIKGNAIKDYNNFNTNDMAIKLNAGTATIGGTNKSEWNTITGCAKGIVYKPAATVNEATIKQQNYISGIANSDGKIYDIYQDNIYGVALGQLAETTKGIVANSGTAQNVQIKVLTGCTAADSTGLGLNITIAGVNVPVTTGDTAADVAGKISSALGGSSWNTSVNGDVVTLIANSPAANLVINTTGNSTGSTFTVSNLINGAAPTDAIQEVDTLTVASGADSSGYVTVNISDGQETKSFTVNLDGTSDNTPSGMAAKIVDAVTQAGGLTLNNVNYKVLQGTGNDANKVIIKQTAPDGGDVKLIISLQ